MRAAAMRLVCASLAGSSSGAREALRAAGGEGEDTCAVPGLPRDSSLALEAADFGLEALLQKEELWEAAVAALQVSFDWQRLHNTCFSTGFPTEQ